MIQKQKHELFNTYKSNKKNLFHINFAYHALFLT
jgi:hypothetical protein